MHLPTWVVAIVVPVIAGIAVATTFVATDAGSGAVGGDTIEISNFEFAPQSLTVAVGAKVTVVNRDGATHTLTAADRTFETGDLAKNDEVVLTVDRPGTYRFFCSIHDYMRGVLEVK